jgi:hypothetical protein
LQLTSVEDWCTPIIICWPENKSQHNTLESGVMSRHVADRGRSSGGSKGRGEEGDFFKLETAADGGKRRRARSFLFIGDGSGRWEVSRVKAWHGGERVGNMP